MQAKEIMSTPVVVTKRNVKLAYVKDLLARNAISSAPVLTESGDIDGIITSTDLTAVHNEELTVADIMTHKVHVCASNARIEDIANTMLHEHIHHMVVMEDGKVLGMISSLDIIKGLLPNK